MRPYLTLILSATIAAPCAVVAQEAPPTDPPPAVRVETVEAPVTAQKPTPQPIPAKAEVAPSLDGSTATTVPPVIVESQDSGKGDKVGQKVGGVAGGVIGGVAGAAVAGPVGKFAGGFVGKRVARALFGKDKPAAPSFRAAQTAPSADQAAADTAERSSVPPMREAAEDSAEP